MSGLSRGCRTCCQKQQNKIQPANKKASANFSGAKIRGAHFPAGGIFVSGLAGKRPRAQRFPAACTFLFGTNRPKSPVYIQQPQRPTRQSPNAFFCSFGFQDAKTRGAYFFSIQSHRFRLGRPISPAANPITTSNKTTHSLPAPAGQHLPPPFFSYRPTQSSINQLPSSRLGRPTPYIPPHHFSKIHQSPSSPPSSRFSPFRTSNSNLIPPLSQRPPLLPSCCRFQLAGQTRNVVSRVGAACKAAGVAGEEPAFLLFPLCFFFFSASLFHLFFSISLAPRLRRDAFIFLFIFSFYFCFFFLFAFVFLFVFFFLLFSLYFSSDFLFLFFLCPFFLLFLSFYFCSYLCFLVFIFIFIFLLSFYLCFSFSFLSFFLFYFFTLLTPISFLIIQPLAGHSFFLPRRQFLPSHPATSGSGKKEKISAKESTGVRWLPGSERAEGGKTEGRNGAPRGMEKNVYYAG